MPRAQIYPRCGGGNVSPQLDWGDVPAGTRSFALTMIDLDVKPSQWSHWIVVDISSTTTSLARGAKSLPVGAQGIVSNFGDAGYDGPCPPAGSGIHRYRITIWALRTARLVIAPDEKATKVEQVLSKLALDSASLTAVVRR